MWCNSVVTLYADFWTIFFLLSVRFPQKKKNGDSIATVWQPILYQASMVEYTQHIHSTSTSTEIVRARSQFSNW